MKIFTLALSFLFIFCCFSTKLMADLPSEENIKKTYTTVACNGFEYCESFGNSTIDEWIESFQFSTIDNTSGSDDGYADYTNFSADVIPGNAYPVTCTMGYDGFEFNEFFRIWIDFNQNGILEDEELVFDPGEATAPVSGMITIPVDAVNGSTLMRVAMKFASVSIPCEEGFSFGEVEDYCVNIINPDFCYNPFVQVYDITSEGATLDWNPVDIAQGYDIRYREVGTFVWTDVYLTEDSLTLTELEACASYEFQIRSDCDTTTTDYSNNYTFETFGCGACIDFEYCQISPPSSFIQYINAVTLADLDNFSGNNGGYADFGNEFPTVLNNDSTYTITLETEFPYFELESSWYVWIDYNSDGDFDDANELAFQSGPSFDLVTEGQITIPSDAVIGLTKMRINIVDGVGTGNACDDFFNGEQEDYCINIEPIVLPCFTPENLDTTEVTTFSVVMQWEEDQYEIGVGYVIRYKAVMATDWTELSTVVPYQATFDLEECTDYEFQVRTVCPQELSDYSESFLFTSKCLTSTTEQPFEPTEDLANVVVYPNPFKDQININLDLQISGDISIALYDMNGKLLIMQNQESINAGAHQFSLNSNNPLSSGMYFLRIATENSVITQKLVRQ